jgi:hypothetical protein
VYQTASFTFRSLIQRLNNDLAFGSVLLSWLTKHKEIIDLQDLQLINAYLNKNAKNPVLLRLRVSVLLINIFKDARGQTFRSTAFPYKNLPTLFHLVFFLLCFVAYRRVFMISTGHEHRHIMFMTGHKNETSIRSYNRHCSVQQKKSPSATSTRHSHAWKFRHSHSDL